MFILLSDGTNYKVKMYPSHMRGMGLVILWAYVDGLWPKSSIFEDFSHPVFILSRTVDVCTQVMPALMGANTSWHVEPTLIHASHIVGEREEKEKGGDWVCGWFG